MPLKTFWMPEIGRTSFTPGWQTIARPACASVSLAGHDLSVKALEMSARDDVFTLSSLLAESLSLLVLMRGRASCVTWNAIYL